MSPHADVLIVTATKVESKAVFEVFLEATEQPPRPLPIGDRIYHALGVIEAANVFLAQSEMGTSGLGASQQTVADGIAALSPTAVIMVGIAFGVDPEKQSIGDILVSKQLMHYEPQRVGTEQEKNQCIPRGARADASPRLLNRFRAADLYWDDSKARVRFGLILSGEKLVDDVDFRQQLRAFEREAIGGEMEGAGLYVACQAAKADWILVKAICDWADGHKAQDKDERQKLAADNAARFVLHVLQRAPLARIPDAPVDPGAALRLTTNALENQEFLFSAGPWPFATDPRGEDIMSKHTARSQREAIVPFRSFSTAYPTIAVNRLSIGFHVRNAGDAPRYVEMLYVQVTRTFPVSRTMYWNTWMGVIEPHRFVVMLNRGDLFYPIDFGGRLLEVPPKGLEHFRLEVLGNSSCAGHIFEFRVGAISYDPDGTKGETISDRSYHIAFSREEFAGASAED